MGGSNGMMEPGNVYVAAPYFISGRTGAMAATGAVARLSQLGMIVAAINPAVVQPTPIKVSQIRMVLSPTAAGAAGGCLVEIVKGTGTPATAGGTAHAPQRRKSTGYPAIATIETHLFVGTTGAITGGTFTAEDASVGPIDWVALGSTDVGTGRSVWMPSDLCPITLEAGEALQVNAISLAGAPILGVAFDFLR